MRVVGGLRSRDSHLACVHALWLGAPLLDWATTTAIRLWLNKLTSHDVADNVPGTGPSCGALPQPSGIVTPLGQATGFAPCAGLHEAP